MQKLILIAHGEKTELITNFLKQEKMCNTILLNGKSSRRNLFLMLLNLADIKKGVFLINAKEKQVKTLHNFLEENLTQNQSGVLLSIGKEKKMEEKKTNQKNQHKQENDTLMVVVIQNGFDSLVLDAIKESEVSGATILEGQGIGQSHSSFMGMEVNSSREVVLIALNSKQEKELSKILKQKFEENGNVNGVIFSLPLTSFHKFNKANN